MIFPSSGGLVTVRYGALLISSCLAKADSAVKVEELSESIVTKELMSGDVVRLQQGSINRAYRVTCTCVSGHPVTIALRKEYRKEVGLTEVAIPMSVSDVGTGDIVSGVGYIEKAPTREWGINAPDQEWVFILSATV